MPELPDLHVFAHNLKNMVCSKKITSIEINNKSKIDKYIAEAMLVDTRIVDITRNGKELYFHLENSSIFSVHLMLNGRFDVCNLNEVSEIKHKIISIFFEDETVLVISDFKGLCKINFNPIVSNVPDALGENFTFDYLNTMAKKNNRKNIKAFLIDQAIIKGIGNAYADEILWKANISPESVIGKVPEENLKDLFNAILSVLKDAVVTIQKKYPNIINGEKRSFLKVHNSENKYTDDGDEIIVKKIASKKTYYVAKQKIFK